MEPYTLDKVGLQKAGRFLLVAMVGALLTALTQVVTGTDFGPWTPVVTALWGAIAEAGRRWATDYTQPTA